MVGSWEAGILSGTRPQRRNGILGGMTVHTTTPLTDDRSLTKAARVMAGDIKLAHSVFALPFALLGPFDYELFDSATIFGVTLSARLVLVPIFVMLMAYPLLSLDRIGMELQNPFDPRRLDHLPLDTLCQTIERNLMEMLREDAVAGHQAPELLSTDLPPEVIEMLANASPRDTYVS